MNIKGLLLLFGGMSLSFVIVLAIMMSAVGGDRPSVSPRRASSAEKQRAGSIQSAQRAQAARPTQSQTVPARPTSPAPPPTAQSEVVTPAKSAPPLLPPVPQQVQDPPPTASQLRPDPTTLREFSTLKSELRREIGALTKDRDAMLQSLAKALETLSPQAAAAELAALDDESIAQTLRHFTADKRTATLAAMQTQRAEKVRRRLGQLGVR